MSGKENILSSASSVSSVTSMDAMPYTPFQQNLEEFATQNLTPPPRQNTHPTERRNVLVPRRINFDEVEGAAETDNPPLAVPFKPYVYGRDVAKPFKKVSDMILNFEYPVIEMKRVQTQFGLRIRIITEDFIYDLPKKYVNMFCWLDLWKSNVNIFFGQ